MVRHVKVSGEEVDVVDTEELRGAKLDWQYNLSQGEGCLPKNDPQNGESMGVRSFFLRPSSSRDLGKRMLRALPPSMRTF